MIILMSLLYFLGNLLDSMFLLLEALGLDMYDDMPMYGVMANVFLFGSRGVDIFIYYNLDKEYNKSLRSLLKFFMYPRSTPTNSRSFEMT